MATGARGEVLVEVGNERVALLYTNRGLAEAEKAMGRSVVAVLRDAEHGIEVSQVAQLLQVGMEYARREMRAGARVYSLRDAYDLMDRIGYVAAARLVVEGVAAVLNYEAEGANDSNPPA